MLYNFQAGTVNTSRSWVDRLALNLDVDSFAEIEITFDEQRALNPLISTDASFWASVLKGRTVVDGGFSAAVIFAGDLPTLLPGELLFGGRDRLDFSDARQGVTLSGDVLRLEGSLIGGNDRIIGSAYNDMLYGERETMLGSGSTVGGRDRIDGGGGDDQIFGQTGADTLNGGTGEDTIKGGSGNDVINGGGDSDVLKGGDGRDVFVVSGGVDVIDGGNGVDALDFSEVLAGKVGSAAEVSLYDQNQPAGVFGQLISWGDATSLIDDIRSIEKYLFGDFNGTLTVNGFTGDEIYAVRSTVTASRLVGMQGDDTFRGGALLGDTVDYGLEAQASGVLNLPGGNPRGATGVVVNLMSGQATDFFGDSDTLVGIENVVGALYYFDKVIGSGRDERITNAEVVRAGGGDDIVEVSPVAFGYHDPGAFPRAVSGPGNNNAFFDGGEGVDTFIMTDGAYFIDLANNILQFVYSGPYFFGTVDARLKNFENVTSQGDIFGNGKNNVLTGGATDDDIRGRRGNDTLDGGEGADTLDGGMGNDTLVFGPVTTAVNVSLATGTGSGNRAEGDTYINIENIVGTHGDDTLTGDAMDNVIDGERGKDVLDGGDYGAKGDTVSYKSSPYSVRVDLSAGSVAVDTPAESGVDWNDTIMNFENVTGSQQSLDVLIGDGGDNRMNGLGGDDELDGMNGADRLIGGRGNDTLTGGVGRDTFFFRRGDGDDTITDFNSAADQIIFRRARSLDDIDFTRDGSDVVLEFANITITVENVTVNEMQDVDIFGF